MVMLIVEDEIKTGDYQGQRPSEAWFVVDRHATVWTGCTSPWVESADADAGDAGARALGRRVSVGSGVECRSLRATAWRHFAGRAAGRTAEPTFARAFPQR